MAPSLLAIWLDLALLADAEAWRGVLDTFFTRISQLVFFDPFERIERTGHSHVLGLLSLDARSSQLRCCCPSQPA